MPIQLSLKDAKTVLEVVELGISNQESFIDCHRHISEWKFRKKEERKLRDFQKVFAILKSKIEKEI